MSVLDVLHQEVLNTLHKNRITAQRFLDVGCGDGSFTLRVSECVKASEVYGIDISTNQILEHYRSRIRTVEIDVFRDKFPFPSGYFDLITAIELIEHLPYGDNFFAESFRVLKEEGYLLITTPNLASWVNRLLLLFGYQTTSIPRPSRYYVIGLPVKIRKRTCFGDPWDLGHVCGYTLKGLSDMLNVYGFKVVEKRGIPAQYSLKIANWLEKILSKVPSLAGEILLLAKKERSLLEA